MADEIVDGAPEHSRQVMSTREKTGEDVAHQDVRRRLATP
jgi:hypothetical protein